MEMSQDYIQQLEIEVRQGLLNALGRQTTHDDVRATLFTRRQERLIENYHKLASAEHEFMEVVDVPIDWWTIQPRLMWVESEQERRIWDYTRNIVSSMPENSVIGRQMRYYFVDSISERWLGIVCLASALTLVSPRHQRLQWDGKTRFKNLINIMNIAVCVPIQPFGTLCGGKLLFVSSVSNEIRRYYKEKYSDDLLAIETTSLYGKSSQYNRVKEFEYLGKTKGDGNIHVSDELWSQINRLLHFRPEYDTAGASSVKLRRINDVSRAVGLSGTSSTHGHRRGFYWGITAENSEAMLCDKDLGPPKYINRPLVDLIAFWRKRWYEMRLPKKVDKIELFDVKTEYSLDNNVPGWACRPRQTRMF